MGDGRRGHHQSLRPEHIIRNTTIDQPYCPRTTASIMMVIAACYIPILEDFVKAMSSALAVHLESSHSALCTTLFAHQEASGSENDFLANELLEQEALRDAFVAAEINRICIKRTRPQSESQLLDDDYEYLLNRVGELQQHAYRASSSFSAYAIIAGKNFVGNQ